MSAEAPNAGKLGMVLFILLGVFALCGGLLYGLFVLTTAGLDAEWRAFCAASGPQAGTGERNFLPFLPWLSGRGWSVRRLEVPDPGEARGINDRLDLAFTARRRRTGASACGS